MNSPQNQAGHNSNHCSDNWPEVLTLEQASAYLSISIDRLLQQACLAQLPGREIMTGVWRFSRPLLDEWLAHQLLAPVHATGQLDTAFVTD
jgi:hypothetical protein